MAVLLAACGASLALEVRRSRSPAAVWVLPLCQLDVFLPQGASLKNLCNFKLCFRSRYRSKQKMERTVILCGAPTPASNSKDERETHCNLVFLQPHTQASPCNSGNGTGQSESDTSGPGRCDPQESTQKRLSAGRKDGIDAGG